MSKGTTRGSKSVVAEGLWIGIDLGDERSMGCVVDREGKTVRRGELRSTKAGLRSWLLGLKGCRVVMEAGTHSAWASEVVKGLGHEVLVANPRQLKLISGSMRKTDKVDAETLARLAGVEGLQLLHEVKHRGLETQAHLVTLRARSGMVRARTALINEVRGFVKSQGERLPKCGADVFARKMESELPEHLRKSLMPVLTSIAALTEQIDEQNREIARVTEEYYPQAKVLQKQMQGVGPILSLTYVLTIEDKGRFRRSRDVGAYVGLVPRQRQSGGRDLQLGITKAGDADLRRLLVGSAQYILGRYGQDSRLRRWGLAYAERGGKNAKKRAVVAVARRLAVLMHVLWVSGEVYDPLYGVQTPAAAAA